MFDIYKGFNSMSNEMSVINLMTSNVQNATTPGFKAGDLNFQEMMDNGVGLGAFREGNTTTFTQGNVRKTGNALDLAIKEGPSGVACTTFFVLSDGQRTRYTRGGHFDFKEGKLVDPFSHLNVQGYLLDENGNKKSDKLETIQLPYDPETKLYGGTYSGFRFGEGGRLLGEVHINDPLTHQEVTKTVPIYQVGLASFTDPGALAQDGPTTYQATEASGKPQCGVAGEDFMAAQVESQHLEMSNVDLPSMYQSMIVAKMVYDAQMSAFKAMTKMTETATSLVK